jgi:hypothetical protein
MSPAASAYREAALAFLNGGVQPDADDHPLDINSEDAEAGPDVDPYYREAS